MNKYLQIVLGIGVIAILTIGLVSCGSDSNSPVAPVGNPMDALSYEVSQNFSMGNTTCPSDDLVGIWVSDSRLFFAIGFKTVDYHTITVERMVNGQVKPFTWQEPPTAAGQARAAGMAKWLDAIHHFGAGGLIYKIWVDNLLVAQWINGMMLWPTVNSCSLTSDRVHPSTWTSPVPWRPLT